MSNSETAPEISPERGVHNPRIVDLISSDADSQSVELLMLETRAWDSHPKQSEQLQEKFNNYLDYVIDGFLVQQYPQYRGRKVRITVEMVSAPTEEIAALLEAMGRYCGSVGIELRTRLTDPAE